MKSTFIKGPIIAGDVTIDNAAVKSAPYLATDSAGKIFKTTAPAGGSGGVAFTVVDITQQNLPIVLGDATTTFKPFSKSSTLTEGWGFYVIPFKPATYQMNWLNGIVVGAGFQVGFQISTSKLFTSGPGTVDYVNDAANLTANWTVFDHAGTINQSIATVGKYYIRMGYRAASGTMNQVFAASDFTIAFYP